MGKQVNVKFAEAYVGCQNLGNIMGLHEETVRKRAKAGKIPGRLVNGKWTFLHADLVAARVHPFADHPVLVGIGQPVPASVSPATPAIVRETDVFFVLDRSSSMGHLMGQARANLRDQLNVLAQSCGPQDVYHVTVIVFDNLIETTVDGVDPRVAAGQADTVLYLYARGSTALVDGCVRAINLARARDRGQAFLISIVTDGEENASAVTRWALKRMIAEASATGRYTFAYAGPTTHSSRSFADEVGLDHGNITQWEQTTVGAIGLNVQTNAALTNYAVSRSAGVTSMNSFYAQPVVANPQDFAARLDSQLQKLDPAAFKTSRVMPDDPIVIRDFAEKKLGGFRKGKVFYQLTESEKVQQYKGIIIQDVSTGAFYSGWEAASRLLGIPPFSGTVRIRPGNLGEFKVFVQSTSVNRKLVPGTIAVALT